MPRSELDIDHIAELYDLYGDTAAPYIPALIAEIKKLRGQLYDAGLPEDPFPTKATNSEE